MSIKIKSKNRDRVPEYASVKRLALRKMKRFGKEDDGAMVVLTLFWLILFLVIAGLGIDLMRHEMRRTHLAAVSDAASLAGAAAANEAEAKAIVEDYFAKYGMSDYLKEFEEGDVVITLNTSKVTVNADLTIDTHLMKLSGVDTLTAGATSTAEKRIPKLEIALVLDVSGSMRGAKLTNLKSAAKQFVTTILGSSDPGDAVISIIPFSFGVTPSEGIYNALTVVENHDYSTCIVFQDDDFSTTTINPNAPYPQQIYTSRYDVGGDFDTLNSSWRSCYDDEYFQILPYSISESALHAKIDSLQADGNTSGNEGIKWAAGLLDPAFRDVTASLIIGGEVDEALSTVPANFDEPETQKVIVMMGDGENTTSHYFNDPNQLNHMDVAESHASADFRGPDSDLYKIEYIVEVFDYAYKKKNKKKTSNNPAKCSNNKWVCVYKDEVRNRYYLHDHYGTDVNGNDNNRYWDVNNESWLSEAVFLDLENDSEFSQKTRMSWEMAWGLMSPDYHSSIVSSSFAAFEYGYIEKVTGPDKNPQMSASCSAIKAEKVVVYTIGFEVSEGGTAESYLKNCASTETRYYRAQGININDAFNSIAANVQNLRLTQ